VPGGFPVYLGNCLASDDGGWGQTLLMPAPSARRWAPLRPSAFSLYFLCVLKAIVSSASPVVACRRSPLVYRLVWRLGESTDFTGPIFVGGQKRTDDIAVYHGQPKSAHVLCRSSSLAQLPCLPRASLWCLRNGGRSVLVRLSADSGTGG